jgi:predicted Zn-dependent protease
MATVVSSTATLALDDIEPKIPPGYKPADSKDELGLWLEVEDYEKKLRSSALLVRDRHLNEYVESVACKVAGDYCPDIRVYVVRNPGFNASMTANGMMQVWTGLLTRVSSEDELAAILGHEVAHYTRLHTLERFRKIRAEMSAGSAASIGIGLLTGVYVPIGQSVAMLSAMAFSRENEREADILGAKMMAKAEYDPHASWKVWEMLIEEEKSAVAKRQAPGLFTKTHPDPETRAAMLKTWVSQTYGNDAAKNTDFNKHVEMLTRHYLLLMEDQIDTNRFGRTEVMLERHAKIGVARGMVEFFRGEMYRQRAGTGDMKLAKDAYLRAVSSAQPHAEAYRNLGYLYLKEGNRTEAQRLFKLYLDVWPDASDREMIEFYLEEN